MVLLLNACSEWRNEPTKRRDEWKPPQIIDQGDEEEILGQHLKPEVRCLILDTVERLSKRHFAEDIKGDHLGPMCHVDAIGSRASKPHFCNHAVYTLPDDMFLIEKSLCRESSAKILLHLSMSGRVALAANTLRVITRCEDIVEFAFDAVLLPNGRRPIDRFPRAYRGKRELVRRDSNYRSWSKC